tara:strand:+ start:2796 stop:4319 length:1524 start_codon:yes stop_codon:yes gene_type:complete
MPKNINNEIQILIKKFENKNFKEVINESLVILKKNDNDFLWNLVGLSFQNLNQLNKSVDSFENAIKVNPKNFSAFNNLGISYKKLKEYKNAEDYLLKSIEINPNYINPIVNLGNIKNETYFFKDAINYYKKAIKLNNKLPLVYLNLSNVYQTINQIDEAKKFLLEAIHIDETFTIADQKLSMLKKYDVDNLHLQKMINKLEKNKLNDAKKKYLCFGISKAFKDIKDYQKSIKYLKLANKLQRQTLNYDIDFHKSLAKKIKSIFSKMNFKDYDKKSNEKKMIFILGMPRSGTTLVEKIISSHSKVSTISEANYIPEKIFNHLNDDVENFQSFIDSNFQDKYFEFIKSFNIKNEIIIDKTLVNFWYLGFIKIFFPDSRIIHISRNPLDNCLSIFENLFEFPQGWDCDQGELAEYYLIYKDLMQYWNTLFNKTILNIKYEEIISNSEKKIKELINFCQLEWEEGCLNYYDNNNPIKTLSVNQANKPIYTSSINKYKSYEDDLNILFSKLS